MVRLKDSGGYSLLLGHGSWMITFIWLLLAFFSYTMIKQQADRLFHLAQILQNDIEDMSSREFHSNRHSPIDTTISSDPHAYLEKFTVPQTINSKEVYATFLSTRIGNNSEAGEFEQDWYFNSTRVLIHRLLRTPETRGRRRVVVLSFIE